MRWRVTSRQVGVEVVAIPGKVEGGFGCVREVEVVVVLGGVNAGQTWGGLGLWMGWVKIRKGGLGSVMDWIWFW